MTLSDISDIAQAIAAVAVIVSLVYLALQTRQAARNARAVMHENRNATTLHHIDRMIDDEFYPLYDKGNRAATDISDAEIRKYTLFATGMIRTWEERFRQKREGMLDESRWAASERNIVALTQMPGFRAVISAMSRGFDPDFGALMDKHVALGRSTPVNDAAAAWRAAAAAELAAMTPPPGKAPP